MYDLSVCVCVRECVFVCIHVCFLCTYVHEHSELYVVDLWGNV